MTVDPYEGLGIEEKPSAPASSQPRDPYAGLGIEVHPVAQQAAPRPREQGFLERNLPNSVYRNLPSSEAVSDAFPAGEASRDVVKTVDPIWKEWRNIHPDRPKMPTDGEILNTIAHRDRVPEVPTEDYDPQRERTRPWADRVADYKSRVMAAQSKWDEEQGFHDSRTPFQRAATGAAFAASQPIRMLSRGEFGLGDVTGLVSKDVGDHQAQQEQDFMRANEAMLHGLKRVGDASLGAAGESLAFGQRIPRDGKLAIGRSLAEPIAETGAGARIAAVEDFRDAGVRPYVPAVSPGPIASAARAVEEVPGINRLPLGERAATERDFVHTKGDISRDLSTPYDRNLAQEEQGARPMRDPLSADQAGSVLQDGLERYRTAKLQDLPEQTVRDLGIDPNMGNARNRRGYIDIPDAETFSTANMTADQIAAGRSGRINLPGSNRTNLEQLSNADIERIIAAPDNATSFPVKQEAMYTRAERTLVPIMKRLSDREEAAGVAPGVNSMQIPSREASWVISDLVRDETRSGVRSGLFEGRLGDLMARIENPQANFTVQTLKSARTAIGKAIEKLNVNPQSEPYQLQHLKRVYAALSQDYEIGLATYAFRAEEAIREARVDPANARISPQFAGVADEALRFYKRADSYTKEAHANFDQFQKIYDAPTVEGAARKMTQALRDKTQNVAALEQVSRALRPEEFRQVLGHVFDNLGRDGSGNFTFERAAKEWRFIANSPRVRAVLDRIMDPEHLENMDRLGRIAEVMENHAKRQGYNKGVYAVAGGATLNALMNPATALPTIGALAGVAGVGAALTSQTFLNKVLLPSYRLQSRAGAVARLVRRNGEALSRELPPQLLSAIQTQDSQTNRQGQQ